MLLSAFKLEYSSVGMYAFNPVLEFNRKDYRLVSNRRCRGSNDSERKCKQLGVESRSCDYSEELIPLKFVSLNSFPTRAQGTNR